MWIQASATITLTVAAELDLDDNLTKEEIEKEVEKALHREANELLGGVEFHDDDIQNINWEEI